MQNLTVWVILQHLNLDGNVDSLLSSCLLMGKGLLSVPDKVDNKQLRRRALLLHHTGPDVQDIFSTLPDTEDNTDYEKRIDGLSKYFTPKVNAAFMLDMPSGN